MYVIVSSNAFLVSLSLVLPCSILIRLHRLTSALWLFQQTLSLSSLVCLVPLIPLLMTFPQLFTMPLTQQKV